MSPAPFPVLAPASNVAEVLERVDAVVAWSIANASRLGYFAALYKRITRAIGAACDAGDFEDGPRMQRLDATFANRYFAALNGTFALGPHPAPSQCWGVAFAAARSGDPVIVLHMLAGVNAHIALDLGVAAAQTAQPGPLEALHADFNMVNQILARQVKVVLDEIDSVSPVLAALYDLFDKLEIGTIDESLVLFRDGAWGFASVLAAELGALHPPTIAARDLEVSLFGRLMLAPPKPFASIVRAIALQEKPDVAKNITALDGIASEAL
jgi:hypothetical protein